MNEISVLVVSSGNKKDVISSIVRKQSETIEKEGAQIIYFPLVGSGIRGYIKNIFRLRKYIRQNHTGFNVVHAHFIWSAIVATISGAKPLVVSLMGSDLKASKFRYLLATALQRLFWRNIIVKTDEMKLMLSNKNGVHVVPNGVDFEQFYPQERNSSCDTLNWPKNKKHILFAANPNYAVKNFALAKKACNLLNDNDIIIHYLDNVPYQQMVVHFNAADAVLLTSNYEGSVNVIKEAMACNRPIVSTNVGDVKNTIGNTTGCYVCEHNPGQISEAIKKALTFKNTSGRDNIGFLESGTIAKKIISIYSSAINQNK